MNRVLLLLCLICCMDGAETKLSAPERYILKQARDALTTNKPSDALGHLQTWQGRDHSAQLLLLGHALRMMERYNPAADAYLRCLSLDGTSESAALSLIQCYVELERWQDIKGLLEKWAPADTCTQQLMYVSINCARALDDLRWGQALIAVGMRRFPTDQHIRMYDLEHLMSTARWSEALHACNYLLKENSQDIKMWEMAAMIYQQLDQEALALAAYERTVLLAPEDPRLRQNHLQAQLAAGHADEAFKQAKILITLTPDKKALALAVRAAYEAGDMQTAKQWLEKMPVDHRGPMLQTLGLRVLYESKSFEALDKQADQLLARAVLKAQTLLWLGRIAEERSQQGRAEMLYELARKQDADEASAQLANLYLARLWYAQERKQEALAVMQAHLKQYPFDEHAQRLLQLMK